MPGLTLLNFAEQIDGAVLARGEEYYERGAVVSLKEDDPGEFVATVRGSDSYRTCVLLDGEDVLETSCSCPYDRGPVCKHAVAVLCALRNNERDISEADTKHDTESASSMEQKVRALPREELEKLVLEAGRGGDVKRIIKTAYADDEQWEDVQYVKSIVREAVDHASDSYGGISYGDTLDAVDGATDVLGYAEEFESSRPRAAAVCCEAVIEVLSPILMRADDSDGDINGTISEAFELLGKIARSARDSGNEALRFEIFSYALKEWSKKKYEGWDCPEMFLSLAADIAAREDEENQFERALARFSAPRADDGDGFYSRYHREQSSELQLRVIERLHPDRVDAFLQRNEGLYPMRKAAIERALSHGDSAEAKRLAEEGMKQAEKDEYPGHVSHFLDVLMQCAEREGDLRKACEIAIRQFLDSHMEPFSYYRRAKEYSGAEWQNRRAEIIQKLSGERGRFAHTGKLADVYIEEGMWNELLALVEHDTALSASYGKRLEKRYPKEIAGIYAKELNKHTEYPGGRDAYRVQCEVLQTIQRLGCLEIAEDIISEWREKYPRRRALMEELERCFPKA